MKIKLLNTALNIIVNSKTLITHNDFIKQSYFQWKRVSEREMYEKKHNYPNVTVVFANNWYFEDYWRLQGGHPMNVFKFIDYDTLNFVTTILQNSLSE